MGSPYHPGVAERGFDSWIGQAFTRDRISGVYVSREKECEVTYSDGDEVESRLLDVLRGAKDRAVGSPELAKACTDFPSRYHLSGRRANLLRPIAEVLRGRVLVAGAGCGAEARFLGESGAEVWAVEGSRRRAEICAERCCGLPNVAVFCARIEEFEAPAFFDAVTLIGVLEYAPRLLEGPDAPLRLLRGCRKFLRPGGALVVAIENLLGLKYFAGAPEDHVGVPFVNMNGGCGPVEPVTFGRVELTDLLAQAGLPQCEFLYPFPDYKFPRAIVRPAALRELGSVAGDMIRMAAVGESSISYERLFSEEMCWPTLVRNGVAEDFANSFLVVAREAGAQSSHSGDELIYSYSDQRRREYAKETIIEKRGGAIQVRRQKLFSDQAAAAAYSQELRDEPFLSGAPFLSGFVELVNRRGWSEGDIASWGRPWFDMLVERAAAAPSSDLMQARLPRGLVDCVPANLVRLKDGTLAAFDQEWRAAEPPLLPFVVFRGLFGAFVQVASSEVPADTVQRRITLLCQQVMVEWGLPVKSSDMDNLVRRECAFQEVVTGIAPDPAAYLLAWLPPMRHDNRSGLASGREMQGAIQQAHRALSEAMTAHQHEIAKRDELILYFRRREDELLASFSEALRRPSTEAPPPLPTPPLPAALEPTAGPEVKSNAAVQVTPDTAWANSRESQALWDLIELERRRADHEARRAEHFRKEAQNRAQVCRETVDGLELFRNRFRSELIGYRNQRAWQVMLAFRKAYTLLLRRGWAGRAEMFRWMLKILRRQDWELAEYDLSFPDPGQQMPRQLWPAALPVETLAGDDEEAMADGKYDVVLLPVFEFDFRYQRPQQLARQFANAGHRVFWISPSRVSHTEDHVAVPIQRNICEIHLPHPIPNMYSGEWTESGRNAISTALGRLLREEAVSECVAILQLPFWRQIGAAMKRDHGVKILYDCIDHWETFPKLGEFTRGEEAKLAAEADVLVVTAGSLFDKHAGRGLRPTLVRNGADYEFFHAPAKAADLGEVRKPVIGYFGAIADWFDFDLVRRAALARPNYSFVLIGGLGLEERVCGGEMDKLLGIPNLHLLGHKNYESMPSYLKSFDVCMIPFRLNEVTMATDPVKLYEYLSQGKPVVTTGMAELEQFSELIYFSRTDDEFLNNLDAAAKERVGPQTGTRNVFAAANSWRNRYQAMDAAASAAFPLVSILIVTHNSAEFINPCLDSIFRHTSYPRYEIIVVDNNSTDGTVELLRNFADRDGRIKLTCSRQNDGFARANNIAARQSEGEYLIFLNADTMVTKGWIGRLLGAVRRDPSVGQAGPVTNWAGNEMRIDVDYSNPRQLAEFASRRAQEHHAEVMDVPVAPLFCALVPRSVWRRVGELDETFGIGMFEDDDFSLRVRSAGFRVVSVEDCFVHHFGQGSFNKLDRAAYARLFEVNKRSFEEKWGKAWVPHRYRASCSGEGGCFTPAEFCA